MSPTRPGHTDTEIHVLPDRWRAALRAVEAAASDARLQYAVVGSLGLAVSLGLPWQPLKPGATDRARRMRDLDVFLVGDASARARFHARLRALHRGGLPVVDAVPFYHAFTAFGGGAAILCYRRVQVPVDARLFTAVRITRDGMAIPVLHPRVQRHLIEMLPTMLAKGRDSVRLLSGGLAEDLARFPPITEVDCHAFRTFKAERRRRYPLRERVLTFRMTLWGWEEDARRKPLVAMKTHIRERHPRVAQQLRRLFG